MDKGTLIKSHISELITMINDLKTVDVKVEDQDQVALLRYLLLPSCKTF